MLIKLKQYIDTDGHTLVTEYSQDEVTVSHVEKIINGGYYTKLVTDKTNILADGIETANITAEVYNYLDEPQTAWTGDVVFVLDGQEQIISTTNGKASITFNTTVIGEYAFTTNIANFRNGNIKVVAE